MKILRENKKYVEKYPKLDSAAGLWTVGRDQIQEIVERIKPMDEQALNSLKELFPEDFFKVVDARLHSQYLQTHSISEILLEAEGFAEVLAATSATNGPRD